MRKTSCIMKREAVTIGVGLAVVALVVLSARFLLPSALAPVGACVERAVEQRLGEALQPVGESIRLLAFVGSASVGRAPGSGRDRGTHPVDLALGGSGH